MVTNEINQNDIIDYYQAVKGRDMELYHTQDLYGILVNGWYVYLPKEVSEAIFRCLEEYKFIHQMYEKTKYIIKRRWTLVLSTEMEMTGRYTFETIVDLPINQCEKEVYLAFYKHLTKEKLDDYWGRIVHLKLKLIRRGESYEYTSPLAYYITMATELYKNMYYYLGKKGTDSVMDAFTDTYFQKIRESSYYTETTEDEINKVQQEIETYYKTMRGSTRLNKGLTIL